jgi:hypothetical protein
MPGRKEKSLESTLTKTHIKILKKYINNIINPLFKKRNEKELDTLVNIVNILFAKYNVSSIYTRTKIQDAISNRRYRIRRKQREEMELYEIFPFKDISYDIEMISFPSEF